jgi:hypothetical protein
MGKFETKSLKKYFTLFGSFTSQNQKVSMNVCHRIYNIGGKRALMLEDATVSSSVISGK